MSAGPSRDTLGYYESTLLRIAKSHPQIIDEFSLSVGEELFREPALRTVFAAIVAVLNDGLVVDDGTLKAALDTAGKSDHFLSMASLEPASPANAAFYIEKLREAASRRALEPVLQDALANLSSDRPLEEIVADLERNFYKVGCLGSTKKTGSFQLRRIGELEIKPPQWLVQGFIEADSLALLFGDPAAGKSFLALDLSACIATGSAFHGRRIAQNGLVVYIAGEGHSGLARRLRAWSIARGVSLDNAPFFISTLPASLCDPGTMGEIERVVASIAKENGPPSMLVLDTWSRNLGGDENSSADTSLAIAALDRLRAPWRAAGLVVHHVGHGEKIRARGSTVLRGAVDLEIRVERGADSLIRVTCTKAKDIQPPEPMAYCLVDIDLGLLDEDGRPVRSAVLEEEKYRAEEAPKTPTGKNQKAALDILAVEIERHRKNVSDSGRDPSVARVSIDAWREACEAAGMDRKRFSDVKRTLKESKAIQIEGIFVDFFSASVPVRCPSAFRPPIGGDGKSGHTESSKADGNRTETGQEPDNAASQYLVGQKPLIAEDTNKTWPKKRRKSGEAEGAIWEDLGAEPAEADS